MKVKSGKLKNYLRGTLTLALLLAPVFMVSMNKAASVEQQHDAAPDIFSAFNEKVDMQDNTMDNADADYDDETQIVDNAFISAGGDRSAQTSVQNANGATSDTSIVAAGSGAAASTESGTGAAAASGTVSSGPANGDVDPIDGNENGVENKDSEPNGDNKTVSSTDPDVKVDPAKKKEPAPQKIAYITIDDGPSRAITPKILDVLRDEGVKATFFVLPHNKLDDMYQRIIDEGHEIGNHSYSHRYFSLYSSRDIEIFRDDVIKAREYIYEKFGYLTVSYRFPGGPMGRGSSIIEPRREILKELGYNDFSWNVDTGDARAGNTDKSTNALVNNVLQYTRNREKLIVLMHDTQSRRTTLEALPRIIQGLREQGYAFDILRNYYPVETIPKLKFIPILE